MFSNVKKFAFFHFSVGDPYLWLMDPEPEPDPTPDPAPFFNDVKDVKKF
jgi:hypothetical protein